MEKKQLIITTSWDDGHALDLRLAELLDKYSIKGTFYVPINNAEHPVMQPSELTLIADKFEIGGHTVNHIYLDKLSEEEARYEVSECKTVLQNRLGRTVDAFCYPGGKYSQRDIRLVDDAGFLFGRTTRLLHTASAIDTKLMDTSVQAFHHSRVTLTKHCLKAGFVLPIVQQLFFYKGNKNFPLLAEVLMNKIVSNGGVFHLWGHSWEIEEFGLWNDLELLLKALAFNLDVAYMNNTECWQALVSNELFKT
jgi:peptidoglycan-N-acetylglucosamine deacetylase